MYVNIIIYCQVHLFLPNLLCFLQLLNGEASLVLICLLLLLLLLYYRRSLALCSSGNC